MNKRTKEIFDYISILFPNASCELEYEKDYELLIAIVLSAQTTDKRVNKVTRVLFNKYKTLEELSNAQLSDLEDIIREIGTFKKKSVFIKEIVSDLIEKYNGVVPKERNLLESLSGVGRKTTNVFLSEFYKIPSLAVDTHVERVSKRLNLVGKDDNVREIERKLTKLIPENYWIKAHHGLIHFGRYHCKAIKPNCSNCKLKHLCNYYKEK